MFWIRASAPFLLALALLGAGGFGARAQNYGYHYGGGWGGPRFAPPIVGPDYGRPRYDGPPPPYDAGLPAPDDLPGPPPDAFLGPPPGARRCYSPEETRDRVAAGKLRSPYEMMRKASQLTRAEALAGKLCHWGDRDIYEIRLLAQDGALLRVSMDAITGQVVSGRDDR